MSILATSLCIAGGVLIGRWIARGGKDAPALPGGEPGEKRAELEGGTDADAGAPGGIKRMSPPKKSGKKREPDLSAFPCALGDVVTRPGGPGEERWLAGAIVLSEERPAAVLFVAPEAGGDRALFAWPQPSTAIVWLEPVPREEVAPFVEPPTSLEVHGVRYERTRRLPLRAERIGAGAPDVGDSVILAEYGSAGAERLILVVGGGTARAWRGPALEPGMYDVMPSGKATLE